MGKYIVQTPLMLGEGKKAKLHAVDAVVELDGAEAKALVDCGALREPDASLHADEPVAPPTKKA